MEAGVLLVSGSSVVLASQTVTLPANSTSYVYLNTNTAAVTSNTSGFPATNCYPLATVVTGNTGVVSLTDNRSDVTGSGGGGGGTGPAGSDTQIQYNSLGAFGANPNFTWSPLGGFSSTLQANNPATTYGELQVGLFNGTMSGAGAAGLAGVTSIVTADCTSALGTIGPLVALEAVADLTQGTLVGGLFGARITASSDSNTFFDTMTGAYVVADQSSDNASSASVYGIDIMAACSGATSTVLSGLHTLNQFGSAGEVTNAYGVWIDSPVIFAAGIADHSFGLYISDQTVDSGTNNPDPWSIVTAGGKHYLQDDVLTSGQVGFGTTNVPDSGISRLGAASLAVGNGTASDFSGALTLTGLSVKGTLTDGSGSVGGSGQVLSSTVTGTKWITSGGGSGTVTSFSAGTLSPLFTTSVATATTTPALSFSLSNAGGGTVFGNNTTSAAGPAYTTAPVLGIPGTSTGSIALASSTASGKYTITAPANAATPTLTLPTGTGTFCVSASSPLTLNATTGAMTFSGAGAVTWDQIGNAAANLTLANAAFTTTFNQTSAAAWLWANTTTATSGTTNASPTHQLAANYWTGAASAADTWTLQSSLAAGTNGASTLSLAHAGSTGNAAVQVPAGTLGTASAWGLTFAGTTVGLAAAAANTVALLGTNPSLRFYNSTTNNGEVGSQGAASIASLGVHLESSPANSSVVIAGNTTTTVNVTDVLIGGQSAHTGTSATQTGVSIGNGTASGAGFLSFSPASGTANFVACQIWPVINQTSTSSGNYTGLLVNVVETALKGSANKLLDLQAGTTGGTSKFTVSNSGAVTNYNGTATVRNGIPAEYASSDLTAQSAAITATTLISAPATGAYRVSWSATITTPDGAASVLGGSGGFQVIYTSPTDSVVKTTVSGASVTSAANTTGTAVGGCLTIYAKTGTNIQYTYGYTSTTPGQMVYELHITVEAL